ncbi:MAG TPA: lysophospholipid acyltransferase family protein [Tepidisphaeraceae bacterium]|jgi:1-acyl-sn-glycerol-3-phosphate acyltransferase|nr:lysophospholipid acyltransferase family protein [Tepidisphaeraceae bacterium]
MPDQLISSPPIATTRDREHALPTINRPLFRLFHWYTRRFARKHFHTVRIARDGYPPTIDAATPIILCMNHPGWWDPLMALVLSQHLWPGRRHYAPIDAAMLEKYRFFRKLGFFGIDRASRAGGAAFFKTASRVAASPNTCLWITAQGRFADPRQRPVELAAGLARLAERCEQAVVLPLAIEYPFWTEREPEALVRFGPPCDLHAGDLAIDDALATTMDGLAADAIAKDAGRFDVILRGSAGSSATYDAWRWMKAKATGRRFSAAHMEDVHA